MSRGGEIAERVFEALFPASVDVVASGDEHVPMLAVLREREGFSFMDVAGLPKEALAELHRVSSVLPGVVASALIMEAWSYRGDARSEKDAARLKALTAGAIEVADLRERTEVLIFNIRAGGAQRLAMCPIERPANVLRRGDLIDPTSPGPGGYTSLAGRFVGDGRAR